MSLFPVLSGLQADKYSNNTGVGSSFIFDFERTTVYPVFRHRRSDLTRGFAFSNDGFGLKIFVCRDMLIVKQPTTEYSNIGLNTASDVVIAGFNNNDAWIFPSTTKVIFNQSGTFTAANTNAQVQFRTLDNNDLNSYFLFQASSSTAMRGGILVSNTDANTSGNSSIKISASSGTSDHARLLISNVQNNSPDTNNCKILETFGSSGAYTYGRNITLGDETAKGSLMLWVDRTNHNTNQGQGVVRQGNASAVPSGNPPDGVYWYVENNKWKFRDVNGFIVTL